MTQAAVDNFTIVYYLEGQRQSETVSSPATTVTLTRLSKGTRYTVQVFATNPIGASPSSNTMTMRTNIDRKLIITRIRAYVWVDSYVCVCVLNVIIHMIHTPGPHVHIVHLPYMVAMTFMGYMCIVASVGVHAEIV